MALGAYGVAILTTKAGLGFWAALPLAVLLVAAISALLSIPALRVTGPYLAMVTIAFGFIVEVGVGRMAAISPAARAAWPAFPRRSAPAARRYWRAASARWRLSAFHYFARSPLGLAMQATASAPAAARSIGIGPLPVRTAAFVLAAAAAGLAGGLQAALTGFIAPSSFPFSQSILFLLVVVVGGAGRTLGPLLGAVVVVLLPEVLAGLAEYRLLVFGAGLLIVLWVAPGRHRRRHRPPGARRRNCARHRQPDIDGALCPSRRRRRRSGGGSAFASRSAVSSPSRASI